MKERDFTRGKASDHLSFLHGEGKKTNKRIKYIAADLKILKEEVKILPELQTNQKFMKALLLIILAAIVGQYFTQ